MKNLKNRLIVLLLFALIAGMFVIAELCPRFPDPDSFYHAKMAMMIRDNGFVHDFPWLTQTIFTDTYIDHHILYHIILIPFVTIFDPLVGMKISATLFGLLAFYTLFQLLKYLRVPVPHLFTLAAMLSPNFFFRMSMPRAPALSVIFLLIGIWAMLSKRSVALFVIMTMFVWLYNGWPLLVVAVVALIFADIVAEKLFNGTKKNIFLLWMSIKKYSRQIIAIASGVLAGNIINPYFPENMRFNLLHIIDIGLFNQSRKIQVGQEWYPIELGNFIGENGIVFLLLLISLVLILLSAAYRVKLEKKSAFNILFFAFLAICFFLMSLKSSRFAEYAIPFILITSALLFSLSQETLKTKIWPFVRQTIFSSELKKKSIIIFLTLTVLAQIGNIIKDARPSTKYYSAYQYEDAIKWIKTNVPENEIIFHDLWDYSMILFYLDDTHRYIAGLDPTFMYSKNPELYALWEDISFARQTRVDEIITKFNAKIVISDSRSAKSEEFKKNLIQSGLFEKVMENEWTALFTCTDMCLKL